MKRSDANFTKHAVTIADIASMAGWSTATVARKMRRPELRFPRPLFAPEISKLKLFDRREIEAWLRGQDFAP